MQFQVPQFIETEDKIVGPLSLRQFAYFGAGGVLSAFLYFFTQPWLWAIGSFFIFAIVIGLAFVKIEGRPLINVAMSAFHFYWKPQTYVWQPEHPKAVAPEKKAAAEAGRSALEEIIAKSAAKSHPGAAVSHAPVTMTHKIVTHETAPAEVKPEVKVETKIQPKHETPVVKTEEPKLEISKRPQFQPEPQQQPVQQAKPVSREAVSVGSALHKSWEDLQTGAAFAKKNSDKQFLEKKMSERYQIFQKLAGDRNAAKRVDYR